MFIELEEKSHILVIDPNPSLREHLDEMFNGTINASSSLDYENLAYLIHGCSSGAVATRMVAEQLAQGSPYNLIFIETQLDDGCGLELISHLWQVDPDVHFVLCSADQQLSWKQVIEKAGESDQLLILQKPFRELELRQSVHMMMRKWQLSKQSSNVMHYMETQIQARTQEIEAANRNLLQAEKLAAIGQLAAGIAHEINTPAQYVGDNIHALEDFFTSLSRIIHAYRGLLAAQDNASLNEEMATLAAQEDLEFILADAPHAIAQSLEGMQQIVRIVQAIKGFSHIGASSLAITDINHALENTLLVARNSYKYIATLETHFGDIPAIECYPAELNQVFLNIIVNAAHAIEDKQQGLGQIVVTTAPTEEGIAIHISDTGDGIPENIRDRIFDPFFTTKDVGRGSGQGLHIAYRIIHEQHGGSLSFSSNKDAGTTFSIYLRRRLDDARRAVLPAY